MARIRYFAALAEQLGSRDENLALPPDCDTAAALVELLRARGEPFDTAFDGSTRILVAVNQEMTEAESEIGDTDEIAFFPPVTGG